MNINNNNQIFLLATLRAILLLLSSALMLDCGLVLSKGLLFMLLREMLRSKGLVSVILEPTLICFLIQRILMYSINYWQLGLLSSKGTVIVYKM